MPEENKEKPSVILKPEEVPDETPTVSVPEAPASDIAPVAAVSETPEVKPAEDSWSKFPPQVDGSNKKSGPSKFMTVVVVLLVAVTVTVGGLAIRKFMAGSGSTNSTETPSQTAALPTPTDSPLPTAAPTPQIVNKDEVLIQVLNGSGVAGQAGLVAAALEKADFTAPDAKNADSQDQVGTVVAYSASVSAEIVDEVVQILEDTFTGVTKKESDDLEDYHIVITTGSEEE